MSTPVHAAIAKRFQPPEFCTLFEVRDAAGFDAKRSADALTMSLWPSRGLTFWGFEVKISRNDWLRELRSPEKSGPIQRFCDRWWVAVASDDIVKDGELPETWGLLVLRKGKLAVKKEAPPLKPEAFTKGFVACLLRSATSNTIAMPAVEETIRERVAAVVDRSRVSADWDLKRTRDELAELQKRISVFEAASGVRIDAWNTEQVGKAVAFVMSEGPDQTRVLGRLRDQLARLRDDVDGALGEMSALKKKKDTTTGAAK